MFMSCSVCIDSELTISIARRQVSECELSWRLSISRCSGAHETLRAVARVCRKRILGGCTRAVDHVLIARRSQRTLSVRRAPFLLWLAPANDLWRSQYLGLEPRKMVQCSWMVGGRAWDRFRFVVSERCLNRVVRTAWFAPLDLCKAC